MNNYLQQKAPTYVVSKDSLVKFTKMAQKKKACNDTSSKSNKY